MLVVRVGQRIEIDGTRFENRGTLWALRVLVVLVEQRRWQYSMWKTVLDVSIEVLGERCGY